MTWYIWSLLGANELMIDHSIGLESEDELSIQGLLN